MSRSSHRPGSPINPESDNDPLGTTDGPVYPARNADGPPDKGIRAWLIVAGAFFVWFNSWGAINAFGVFQTYYSEELLRSHSASDIAWIGSSQNFLVLFIGFLSGPLYDAGYGNFLLGVGGVLNVLGMMMLSLAKEYYQVFLSQGICVGIGWGLMFTPAASLPSRFFKKELTLATGLASAGTGIGGIVYSVAFARLLEFGTIGFPWAVRVLGFLALVTSVFASVVMRFGMPPPGLRRHYIDWGAATETSFIAYIVGGVLTMAGLSAPYYYANLYAIETGLTSTELGFYVVTVINTGSFFGRLMPPLLALRLGVFNVFILSYLAAVAICFCFIAARSRDSIMAVAALYGFFSGSLVALSPVTIIRMTPAQKLIGTRMGMAFALPSIGVLVGSPICGAILNQTKSFTYVWIFSGTCLALATICMIICRLALTGLTLSMVF